MVEKYPKAISGKNINGSQVNEAEANDQDENKMSARGYSRVSLWRMEL